jgi:hypothetical protein
VNDREVGLHALHLVRFLRAAGVELDARMSSRMVRPAIDGPAPNWRPIGVFLQARPALDAIRSVIEAPGPPGVTAITVHAPEGAGLRTARLLVARVARLNGFLAIDSRFGPLEDALTRVMRRACQSGRERLQRQAARLAAQHPRRALQARAQRVDDVEQRLLRCMAHRLQVGVARLEAVQRGLARLDPRVTLRRQRERIELLDARRHRSMGRQLETAGLRLRHAGAVLASVNPTAVLERGYAIARRGDRVLRDPSEIPAGEAFEVLLAGGAIDALRKP